MILYIHSYICVSYLQGFSRVVYPKALVVEHHPYLYAFVYVTLYCIIWTSLVTQSVKRLPPVWETGFDPWVGKIPWRRKWQPTPVFLPGESRRQRNLAGYSPWGHKESDMTE